MSPLAHLGHFHWRWQPDPWAATLLCVSASLYGRGLFLLWQRAGAGRGIRLWEAAAFATGWGALAVALISPLDPASDLLFSAHMSQHELLMVVAAPLMVLARPGIPALFALPSPLRMRVASVGSTRWARNLWRGMTHPLVALIVHAVVRWAWHWPPLFEAALRNEAVHALQHATFFGSAALFYWALLHGRYGRAGYGVGVLYAFVTAVHTGVLGALLTFARGAWYPLYTERAGLAGADALEDQGLAGLMMWVPAGLGLTLLGLALLAAWLSEAERRQAHFPTRAES